VTGSDTERFAEVQLARAAAAGESGAFESIVRRHGRRVLGLGLRLTGNRADAEDLAQDVFVRVLRALPSFRGEASLATWITRVTVNAARNRHRDGRRRGSDRTSSLDEPLCAGDSGADAVTRADRLDDPAPSPERQALSAETGRRLEAALARLAPEFREALVLREIEGLSYQEIATALEVEVGTVKSRIARARARLQDELADLVRPPAEEAS
jgi:RNA polymerase sigma-70 factor (ECF subfamily)